MFASGIEDIVTAVFEIKTNYRSFGSEILSVIEKENKISGHRIRIYGNNLWNKNILTHEIYMTHENWNLCLDMLRKEEFKSIDNFYEHPNLDLLDERFYKPSFRENPPFNTYNNRIRSYGKGDLLVVYEKEKINWFYCCKW